MVWSIAWSLGCTWKIFNISGLGLEACEEIVVCKRVQWHALGSRSARPSSPSTSRSAASPCFYSCCSIMNHPPNDEHIASDFYYTHVQLALSVFFLSTSPAYFVDPWTITTDAEIAPAPHPPHTTVAGSRRHNLHVDQNGKSRAHRAAEISHAWDRFRQ